jgi:phosphoribosylglycinamide formyltransferase-1
MVHALHAAAVELVVCAGYNRVLSDHVLASFPDAILNIHPSLLPAFGGGMNAVEDALAAGVKVTGCTVHLLAAGAIDGGPIVLQAPVAVEAGDDAETLRLRIHHEEWRLLPRAVELWATGRIERDGTQVRIRAEPHLRQGVS